MKNRHLILSAFGITAFILALALSGLMIFTDIGFGMSRTARENIPELIAREETYQDLIAEANSRITSLNENLAREKEKNISDVLSIESVKLLSQGIVDPEFSLMQEPALVTFEGTPAYEVVFQEGVIYLDAQSGDLLVSTLPERISSEQAIQIAADFLKITDTSSAAVSRKELNGNAVFEVRLANFIVTINPFGKILKAQQVQYVSLPPSSNPSSDQDDYDDHEDEYDEYEEEDDD